MKGTIIRRGNSYSVVLDLGRGPDGKRIRRWHSGYRTRKEAEAARVELLAKLRDGSYVTPDTLTLSEYLEKWLAHMATIRRARTVERYRELARLHVTPSLGRLRLQQLTALHLQELYAQLGRDGARRDGRGGGLSARTVGHVHRMLHRALRQAVRWRLLAVNPAAGLELPEPATAELVALTQAQAKQLLATAGQAPAWLRLLVTLGLALGLRRGEALGLHWRHVDLDQGTVSIRWQLVLVGGRVHWERPKTTAGERQLVLPAFAVEALRRHRTEQRTRKLALGAGYHPGGPDGPLVACYDDGRPVRPDHASKAFRALARRAGLPESVHVHTLRHSAASFLAAAGVPASDIAAQLGHADGGALALRVYVHALPDAAVKAAARLQEALGGEP